MQEKIKALFNVPQVLTLSDAPHWPAEAEPLPSALVSVLLKLLETLTAPAREVARYVQEDIRPDDVAYTAISLSFTLLIIGCGCMELKMFCDRLERSKKAPTRPVRTVPPQAQRQMTNVIPAQRGEELPDQTDLPHEAPRTQRLAKVLALMVAIKSFVKGTTQSAFSKLFNNNDNSRGT